jgi:putative hemolysin
MVKASDVTAGWLTSPRTMVDRVVTGAAGALGQRRTFGSSEPAAIPTLGRIGSLEVRLATTRAEVRVAQALRYRVFFEEGSARADLVSRLTGRDADRFDRVCDHLMVIDHDGDARRQVVGTYRLLRQDRVERVGGFYTAGEFDIAPILARHAGLRFLELGRSCVLAPWRTKRTVELLWHGIWAYVLRHRIDVMIGCASLEGTDPDRLALPLSFLHRHALAEPAWRAHPLAGRGVAMDLLPADRIDARAALQALPPLIKGYLRLGARVGDGAVIDRAFGTTDVLIVLPVTSISSRYVAHYGADAGRYAC